MCNHASSRHWLQRKSEISNNYNYAKRKFSKSTTSALPSWGRKDFRLGILLTALRRKPMRGSSTFWISGSRPMNAFSKSTQKVPKWTLLNLNRQRRRPWTPNENSKREAKKPKPKARQHPSPRMAKLTSKRIKCRAEKPTCHTTCTKSGRSRNSCAKS